MSVRRVVPDIRTESAAAMRASRDFYGLLGLAEVMNEGWVMTMAAPGNPTAQVSFMTREESAPVQPDVSIEVDDVDAVHDAMVASGAEIVHSLRDEAWGVRRFFALDPNGTVVNVLTHR
ncbi:VOC family protein [Streptomyces hypolithicus]